LGSVAIKIGILVVATVVFIVVYGWLIDYLQRRGP
jgi:preprotein translocase subunit SecE